MTSYIKFTPLSGARNEQGLCYLLEIDDAKILLDCGWLETFNVDDLEPLKRVAPRVDAVLLSHADIRHLGAYPYALAHLGLTCPVYGTLPMQYMGRLELRDIYQSRRDVEDFKLFGIDDIETAFNRIVTLKHSQPIQLSGKCQGITVVAYTAGHTIGGALWKIHKDTEEIVYAVDYNHKKERHLNGTVLHANGVVLETLARPSVLITDAYNALSVQPPRKNRDQALFETVTNTVQAGGSVLIPTDAAVRVLELAYLLDQHWAYHRIKTPILMLGHTSYYTVQYAKSMTEWMGGQAVKQFHQSREHPFEFRSIRLLHRVDELEKYPGAKVVLATSPSLEGGFARELFMQWATDPKNVVVLTERAEPGSLSRMLRDEWQSHFADANTSTVHPAVEIDRSVYLQAKRKILLEGEELRAHLEAERTRREREAHEAAVIARSRNVLDEALESDSSGSEDEDDDLSDDGRNSRIGMRGGGGDDADVRHRNQAVLDTEHDLYVRDGVRSGGFFKQTQSFPMFPFTERRRRFDDYGEAIHQDHYMQDIEGLELAAGRTVKAQPNFGSGTGVKSEEEKAREPEPEAPCKYTVSTVALRIQCKVQYLDFEGLSDGRSIKTILPQVAPRKLIVVHGSDEATEDLARSCLASARMTHDVFAPSIGETLNIGDSEVAFLAARVQVPLDSTTPTLQAISHEQQRQRTRQATIVGHVKLTDLRRVLQQNGMQAEFRDEGVLVCNDRVAIRKTAEGRVLLEGSLSSDYFKIRRLLYSQLAIV
ncbi:beta-lactamase-like protein [Thamnocephalis sphaerospora]|uniref:Cleavage and polyadenylation specificity factor subunit 2 n=1 Tax=Thamnocephalis sphaerospora TaxID=78915 RepID=A0A4P9XPU6_9FUNG|nr:beta-lactamase-like protein [Thamnocephalis sphaerospora]|eukprot:RKP07912.1 beta-lactamase-like protein [Thamnocephalis sphaerospora]